MQCILQTLNQAWDSFFCDYQQVQLSENPTRIASVELRDSGLHLGAFEDT